MVTIYRLSYDWDLFFSSESILTFFVADERKSIDATKFTWVIGGRREIFLHLNVSGDE